MLCPKCSVENFEFPGPCLQCAYKGEAKLLEAWLNLNFLLQELATWRQIPDFYRERLRKRYGKQRRDVEVSLGLRPPPMDRETAAAARQELANLKAFVKTDMLKWRELGWLTPARTAKLLDGFNQRIISLQNSLTAAPPPENSTHPLPFVQARLEQLNYQLQLLKVLDRTEQLANDDVFEEAQASLTAELHQVEIKLGLRPAPQAAVKAEPVPTIVVPKTAEPPPPPKRPLAKPASPPRPPRPPLTWDRVWETLLSERTLRAILFLGATLLFAAAVSLVIWNWGTFPPWLQVTFMASFTTVFYGLGWYVRNKMKLLASGIALSAVASLLVPLDFYAFYLSGGFLGLVWSDVWLLTSAVCLAAYLLTVYLIRAEFFGYLVGVAAGSLLAASLRFVGIESEWWLSALAGLALTLSLAAILLAEGRLKGLQRWQVLARPFWHLAAGGVTALLTLSSSWYIIGQTEGPAFLTSLALSWWLGGLVYLLAVSRFKMRLVAMAAAVSFPIAALLTQQRLYASWEMTAAWYALGWALLTPIYLLVGRWLQRPSYLSRRLGSPELGQAFSRIALVSCVGLMIISFGWSLGDAGAIGLTHLILALTTITAVRLWQRPNLLFFSSLFLMSASAGWVSSLGGTVGYLGLGWALLAIGHIVVALRLANQSIPSPYAPPLFRGGWAIGALALVPPLITQERPILTYTLANWIALNGWLALLTHEGRLNLSRFWPTLRGRLLRLPDLSFQWTAALLLLPWLWLTWTTSREVGSWLGLVFLGLAWLILAVGRWLRRVQWRYGRPWFMAAQLSALLAIAVSPFEFEQAVTAILFLAASAFYLVSTRILHNRWWLVLTGFTFPIGLLIGLDWLAVPGDQLLFSLSLTVLAFIAGPLLLQRYGGVSGRYRRPLTDVAYFIAAVVIVASLGRVLLSNRSDSILLWMAATEAVLALAVGLYAWAENEEGFGHIAAWLGVLAGGFAAGAFSQGRGSSAAKAALIAVVYILGERALRRAALKYGWRWRQTAGRGWRLFRRPILQAGWGVSIIAVLLALLRNMLLLGGGQTRETWAIIALLLITGLYLLSSWLYRRYPQMSGRRVWWAAVLSFFPWTLLTHQGWYIGLEPQMFADYAVSWALLALFQLGFATLLTWRAVDKRWITPPKDFAHFLLPLALLWGAGNAAVSSLTVGLGIVFYLLAVYSDRLSQTGTVSAFRRSRFLYVAAVLVPIWAAYNLENFSPEATLSSFGILLLSLSLPLWLLGRLLEKHARDYRMPLYLVAYGTAVLGTLLVIENQTLLIGALLFDAFLGILSARFFKKPVWLYVTIVTLPAAWLLTLEEWSVAYNRFGWGLLILSQLYIVIGWWLSIRNRSANKAFAQRVSSVGLPFLIGALGLISLSLPLSSQGRLTIQIGYCAAAFLLVQTAVWLRQPILSAIAAALLTVPYWLTITDMGVTFEDYGLALWPLIIVYLLLGYGLDKFVGVVRADSSEGNQFGILKPFPWHSPDKWLEAAFGRMVYWWALPFYNLAFLGTGLSVLLSLFDFGKLTAVLLLTAVAYGWATAYFRLRGWLLLTIAASQIAVVAGIYWLDWRIELSQVALLFLPVTFITAVIGLFIEQHWQEGALFGRGGRIQLSGWSRPFFVILAVNLLIGQLISLNFGNIAQASIEGVVVTLAHIVLVFGLAVWWASSLLATVPILLGLVALVQILFFRDAALTSWPPALALLALGYGLAGYYLRLVRKIDARWVSWAAVKIWEWPLLVGGWLVSGLSWLLVVFSGLRVAVLAFRAIFRLTLLTPTEVAQVQMVVAVLAILGLFYLAAAVVERHARLAYLPIGMLLVAWTLEWGLVWSQREVQWYAIPAGFYLLLVGYLEWQNGSRALARWIDRLALVLLLGTSFWQSLGPDGWPYALLMGFEGLLITWWGSTRRLRRFLYAGVIGVTMDVVWQLIDPLLTATNRWIVFGIVGVFLVSLAILVERRLESVMALTKDVRRRLENWE